jgi:membrane protein implicated in regulation of membrane protease activity
MDLVINEAINPWMLGIIGLGLMAFELVITTTFVAFWLGMATFAVAITTGIFPQAFTWQWQIVLILGLAAVFYAFFSRKLESSVQEAPEKAIFSAHAGDMGRLRQLNNEWVVEYQGTFWSQFHWQTPMAKADYTDSMQVAIVAIDHNRLLVARVNEPET